MLDVEDEMLLDVNELVKGYDYFLVGIVVVSCNNVILVYLEDIVSCCLYIIKLCNIDIGEYYLDIISEMLGGIVWVNDNIYFFYVKKDF